MLYISLYIKHVTPELGPFGSTAIILRLGRSTLSYAMYIPNIKVLGLVVSENRLYAFTM